MQDARLLADVLAEAHHDDLDLRVAIGCYERLMRANGDAAVRAASPCITRRLTPHRLRHWRPPAARPGRDDHLILGPRPSKQ